jgi:hypothetical protein
MKGELIACNADKPCRVTDVRTSKPGKHGRAKCRFTAVDIFDGQRCEVIHMAHQHALVPVVARTEYMCMTDPRPMARRRGRLPRPAVQLYMDGARWPRAPGRLAAGASQEQMGSPPCARAARGDTAVVAVVLAAVGMEQISRR